MTGSSEHAILATDLGVAGDGWWAIRLTVAGNRFVLRHQPETAALHIYRAGARDQIGLHAMATGDALPSVLASFSRSLARAPLAVCVTVETMLAVVNPIYSEQLQQDARLREQVIWSPGAARW